MLSYRHAFHAGNHADVLKHVVLVELLAYLAGKDKRLWYIDTHAGAGIYSLTDGHATVLNEHADGLGRLWPGRDLPAPLQAYLDLVAELNPSGALTRSPGSPWLANRLARDGDRLWLCELHPGDHAALAGHFAGNDSRVTLVHGDGFAELRRLLPPEPRRALVMIDPSYELASDYTTVADSLADSLRRFASGVYAVWYPLLGAREAQRLRGRLLKCGARRWLDVRLRVRRAGEGLQGSGMFVVNPPWTLPDAMAATLPDLVTRLGQDDKAAFDLEYHLP